MQTVAIPPNMKAADLVALRKTELGLTAEELAASLGYRNSAVIDLIETGVTRIPISKVPELADVLMVERGALMRLVLGEADESLLKALERCLGPVDITQGEITLIEAVRRAAPGRTAVPITFSRDSIVTLIVA